MTKSAGSKTCPFTNSKTARSTFGRSGSIKSNMNFTGTLKSVLLMQRGELARAYRQATEDVSAECASKATPTHARRQAKDCLENMAVYLCIMALISVTQRFVSNKTRREFLL
jgi:hypothetical protein